MNLDNALKIEGWMNREELAWLADKAINSNHILEIGCYKGRSTRALADNTNGIVHALDPWNGSYFSDDGSLNGIRTDVYDEFYHNLRDHIHNGKVVPIKKFSWQFETPNKFDFIFIDGDHRESYVRHDIRLAERIILPGGIISGHDYNQAGWPSVKRVVDDVYNGKASITETIWWWRANES
jgi:predicted O-methyltransferase YrrM